MCRTHLKIPVGWGGGSIFFTKWKFQRGVGVLSAGPFMVDVSGEGLIEEIQ